MDVSIELMNMVSRAINVTMFFFGAIASVWLIFYFVANIYQYDDFDKSIYSSFGPILFIIGFGIMKAIIM